MQTPEKEKALPLRLCLQLVVLESFTSYQARHERKQKGLLSMPFSPINFQRASYFISRRSSRSVSRFLIVSRLS